MSVQKSFLVLGAVLFLIGLLSGLATGMMANARMGLSAHMQGITNGTFLLAVGAAWRFVSLGKRLAQTTFFLVAYGTAANLISTLLAAAWNTGQLTPIHSPSPTASPIQEAIVSFGLLTLTVAMIAGTTLILFGLVRGHSAN